MTRRSRFLKHCAAVVLTGGLLMQVGPCTGDQVRSAFGSGARTMLNGLFGNLTDAVVGGVFNLP